MSQDNRSLKEKINFFIFRKLARFNFDSRRYWERRYKLQWDSGHGSYGLNCKAKAKVMNEIIDEYKIDEVLELGCGDGNQLQYYNIPHYFGLDVSATTIRNCIEKYKDDTTKSFMFYDPLSFRNSGKIFNSQVAFSSDVLFHLVEEEIFLKYLKDLFSFARDYVIIFSSNGNVDSPEPHVKHRKFTDYVEKYYPEWKVKDVKKCIMENGEPLDDWYIFHRA